MDRLTIIGMGLIGTSFGLALKKARIQNLEIVGHDLEPTNSLKAQKRGALDRVERNIFSAINGAKIIVLAIPVLAIKEMMELIGPSIEEGTIVTDTGSTKLQVTKWADEILPSGVNFIGGHPMAGREISGPDGADENLFNGAVYAICPSPTAEKFAQKINADKVLVQKSGYFARSAKPNEKDLGLIFQTADMVVDCAMKGQSGVVGLDEDNNNQLTCIEFDRIKGGKQFNPQIDWFQLMLREIGQK